MFSTGEFSRIARVSKRLLQFYDEEGLLQPAHTDPRTGYRKYRAAQLHQLNRILTLREVGLSLAEIRKVLNRGPGDAELLALLERRRQELQSSLREDLRRLRSIEARLTKNFLPDVVTKSVPETQALAARTHLQSSREAWPWIVRTAALMQQALGGRSVAGLVLTMAGDGFETEDFTIQAYLPHSGNWSQTEPDFFVATLPALPAAATVVQSGGPDLFHRGCAAIGRWVEFYGHQITGTPREVLLSSPVAESCDDLVVEAQFQIKASGAFPIPA